MKGRDFFDIYEEVHKDDPKQAAPAPDPVPAAEVVPASDPEVVTPKAPEPDQVPEEKKKEVENSGENE